MALQFARQELYEIVWAEPMSRLAAKLGISDVALAKACRRGKVPTPGLGYWAKLQHGKAVERAALPAPGLGVPDIIHIEPQESKKSSLSPELEEKVRAERTAEAKIVATKSLRDAHPIVRTWLQPAAGRLQSIERRRLRILSTLFKELEKRGYAILPDTDRKRDFRIKVGEEIIECRLEERRRQLRVRLKPEDRRFPWEPEWHQELQLTGELVFRIETWPGDGVRKQWRDTKRKRLEDQLNDIIAGLIIAGASLHTQRTEREEREQRWRAEEQKRRELEEAKRKRQEELQGLLREVEAWQRAIQIRTYVQSVRTAIGSGEIAADLAEIERWAAWALGIADEVDPLNSGAWSRRSDLNR